MRALRRAHHASWLPDGFPGAYHRPASRLPGSYFLPLQIGAREMAFPAAMNLFSFWVTVAPGSLV